MIFLADMRRHATVFLTHFLMLALLLLSSCKTITDNSPFVRTVSEASTLAFEGLQNDPITRQMVEEIPYASMLVKLGNSGWGLLVLASVKGDELTWMSEDKIILVTKNGRIIKTAGFGRDLARTKQKHAANSPRNILYIDLPHRQAFSTPVYVKREINSQVQQIEILEKTYQVQKVVEAVSSPELNTKYGHWKAKNEFYIDAKTGFVWQSKQYVSPDLPLFETKMTKPFGF